TRDIGGWRNYKELGPKTPPDLELLNRAVAAQKVFTSTHRLTAFKFNSAWRRNSYLERRNDEQTEYLLRMRNEPDFLEIELSKIAAGYAAGMPEWPADIPSVADVPDDAPPGAMVT
ncbi:MAG: hypothetical protein JZU63_09400, partial [Rhodoferax sp.]|nr:hypothetical protein [Rhodoferax sp.]